MRCYVGVVVCALIGFAEQASIEPREVDFNEVWDYTKIVPHDDPLLKEKILGHVLPSQRTGKSADIITEDFVDLQNLDASHFEVNNQVERVSCSVCSLGVSLLNAEVKRDSEFGAIREKFVSICVTFKVAVETVCGGVFDLYGPVVLPVLKMITLDPGQICALLLSDEKCGSIEGTVHNWNITLGEAPVDDVWSNPIPDELPKVFKVLQISDTHFDPYYEAGAIANCDEPLCCRKSSTVADTNKKVVKAGIWGSYGKCDLSKRALEHIFTAIAKEHPDIDYVIWTGDIPPHDIWEQTRHGHIENIRYTTETVLKAFPNVPIFPAIGNHEGLPSGHFAPSWMKSEDQSIDWLYSELSAHWSKWLPDSVNSTVSHGGFYSVLIRPRFRVISLNTNYCHAFNWWLMLNSTDPSHELAWLVYELEKAEAGGEKVHIIGHIPPGAADCFKTWSRNYYAIVNRFKNTVVAQFFGHTHNDEFEVFYDDETKQPSAVAYVAPSITTFENLNPGYRIYYVSGDFTNSTFEVIDHETWAMDLASANARPNDEPEWHMLYTAKKAYGLQNLRPAEWSRLIENLVKDEKVFDLFYRYFMKNSPVRVDCDDACRFEIVCSLRSALSHSADVYCTEMKEALLPDKNDKAKKT